MKKKEKIMILILVIITIFVIGVLLIVRNTNTTKEPKKTTETIVQSNQGNEELVKQTADGTKVNVSSKLKETKTIDGLEISGIQLTEQNNVSLLTGDVKNTSETVKGEYPIRIFVLDKDGNEIIEVGGYIKALQPGETTVLNCSATFDYANAYDIRIEKK